MQLKRVCRKNNILVSVFILALAVMLLCTACDTGMPAVQNIGETQKEENQDENQNESTTQKTEAADPIEIIISHSQNQNTPEDIAAKAMQTRLQELLGDKAEVILYADYQLGSAKEQLEAMQLGRVHITIQPASVMSQYVDDMKVFTLPYLFSANQEDVIEVLNGPLEQEALERISMESGEPDFIGLGLWFGGYKYFTFHGDESKTIHSPADFQGLHIAVPDASLIKAQYQHWGAIPEPTDTIALYSTLEQHLADGTEATAQQIASNYLYEVQHNVVRACHSAEIYVVAANAQWFAALPAEVQNAVTEAEAYGREILNETLPEKESSYIDTIRQAEGVRYDILDEKEIAIFQASVLPIYTEQLAGSPWQIAYAERIRKCFSVP